MIRLSSGTAAILGLLAANSLEKPTTAYLLVGERCQRDCRFCAQARTSFARTDALSRVTWPGFDEEVALTALAEAYAQGRVQRCCLQVTLTPDHLERVTGLARKIAPLMPLCAAVYARTLGEVERFLEAGVDIVGLSLDAANPQVYSLVKGGDWQKARDLIREASQCYPGHIATHLIVGLGESEKDVVQVLDEMLGWGVIVGLFAFTPVRGTALEGAPPPPLASYRRLQIAHHLMREDAQAARRFRFSADGRIADFGVTHQKLQACLADGQAFRTSGCPGCNRPYYNEHPGSHMYNYPRPLTAEEAVRAIEEALV